MKVLSLIIGLYSHTYLASDYPEDLAEEIKAHEPYLKAEIRLCGPKDYRLLGEHREFCAYLLKKKGD